MRPRAVALLFTAALCLAACRADPATPLGPPDSFVLLERVGAGPPPVVRPTDPTAPEAAPLARVLSDGFGAEMVRTVYLVKQFAREVQVDGRRFPDAGRAVAADALPIVLGERRASWSRGLALDRWLGGPEPRPGVVWLGFGDGLEGDRALVQTVAGRLAAYALQVAVTGGALPEAEPADPLAAGYRQAMEVIAREWRVGKGPAGVVPADAGTAEQRALFASVRENRFVLPPGAAAPLPPEELMRSAGVAATVLHRLAQTRSIAGRPAAPAFYAPFVTGRVPEGVSPAAVLGSFRNFQAKLLGAWGRAALAGRPPRDIADLVELYGAAFPDERREARRVFLATTYGATVKPGGVSPRPADATASIAELDRLLDEVEAGRRPLR